MMTTRQSGACRRELVGLALLMVRRANMERVRVVTVVIALWNVQVDSLYCLAIVHRRDVRSLRDLRPSHIPLLRNILVKGSAAIHDKFGVATDQLRVYLHYMPSYYHLHVHFVHASHDASFGMAAGKSHALQDVISSLEMLPEYYQRASLTCALGQNDPLYAKLAAHAGAA